MWQGSRSDPCHSERRTVDAEAVTLASELLVVTPSLSGMGVARQGLEHQLLKNLVKESWSVINAPRPSWLRGMAMRSCKLSQLRLTRVVETRQSHRDSLTVHVCPSQRNFLFSVVLCSWRRGRDIRMPLPRREYDERCGPSASSIVHSEGLSLCCTGFGPMLRVLVKLRLWALLCPRRV